ncbi:MAG: hypothetical protein C4523_15040 [Myxococcales bacterium]|nr:MAG: hypothetical protein C4523_15040 [Myxococcales bacterium]
MPGLPAQRKGKGMKKEHLYWLLAAAILLGVLAGCAGTDDDSETTDGDNDASTDGDDDGSPDGDTDSPGDTFYEIHTTLTQRLEPTHDDRGGECAESAGKDYCKNPASAYPDLAAWLDYGFGELEVRDGEAFTRNETLAQLGEPGTRRSLFAWAHLSDIHITDEEGAMRLGAIDQKQAPAALRPMDMYSEVVLDAAVRTINYFSGLQAFNLAVITGDFTDTAQKNEAANFMRILNGGEVDPDSGDNDDPVPGPGNDSQDPFEAEGLDMPWIAALGNHDELILGNWPVDDEAKAQSVGGYTETGTRNGQTFEVVSGEIPADPERETLGHTEMIGLFAEDQGDPAGHGFGPDNVSEDRGYYVYDPPDQGLVRFIVLDTAYRPQGFEGQSFYVSPVIDVEQYENFLLPELERAATDKKLVIVAGHHPSWQLQDDGFPERFIAANQLVSALLSYPNVLAHCFGHSHENTFDVNAAGGGASGYVEVQSASLMDWPQQFRFFELVDNGNGTLSLFTAVVDHAGPAGSLSETSRSYSLIDVQSAWGEGEPGEAEGRNVEMIFTVPEGFAEVISAASDFGEPQALSTWETPRTEE